jgi:Protein of unknown function (DUF2442)
MNSTAKNIDPEIKATKLWFEEDYICVELFDGRLVKTPIAFYPRLANATQAARDAFEISGGGHGVHWPDLDEDLTVEGIVLGRKARF